MRRLVILGAGTAGTMMANKLVRRLPDDWAITVVDRDDVHVYQPGLLFLPFGQYEESDILKRRSIFFPNEIQLNLSGVHRVEADKKQVAERTEQAIENLAFMPTGRKGRVGGTYEKVVAGVPYIIAYALSEARSGEERLTVLRIIHGARHWPRDEWPGES